MSTSDNSTKIYVTINGDDSTHVQVEGSRDDVFVMVCSLIYSLPDDLASEAIMAVAVRKVADNAGAADKADDIEALFASIDPDLATSH